MTAPDSVYRKLFLIGLGVVVTATLGWTGYWFVVRPNLERSSTGPGSSNLMRIDASDHNLVAMGEPLYAANCAACHGPNGGGGREFGAARLNDAIWLRGSDRADLKRQILNPRMGAMPAWGQRLDPVTIKMLATYVHSLGGGEDFVEVAKDPEVKVDEQP